MSFLFNPKESNHSATTSTGSLDELLDSSNQPHHSGTHKTGFDRLATSESSGSGSGSYYSTSSTCYDSTATGSTFAPCMKDDIKTITFSFAAAGWLQVYLFGCAHALIENVPGVRIEGLDDTYAEYLQKKLNQQQAKNPSSSFPMPTSKSSPTTSKEGISPILPSPKKLDQTQQLQQQREDNENENKDTKDTTPTSPDQPSTNAASSSSSSTSPNRQPEPPLFKFVGSSAGSLASAAILLGTDMNDMLEYAVGCVNYARSHWTHAFELRKFVEQGIAKFAIDIFQQKKKAKIDANFTPMTSPGATPEHQDLNIDDEIVEKIMKKKRNSNVSSSSSSSSSSDLDNDELNSPNTPSAQTIAGEGDQDPHNDSSCRPSIGEGQTYEEALEASKRKKYNKDTSVSFFTLLENNEKHQNELKNFPGEEGGWLGSEFFFPKHVVDQLRERLGVYATSLPWIQEICFTEYESTVDLEEALVASCLLAPLAGLPFRLRKTGEWVCDGGLRSFQPRKGMPGVVTISAMYFNAADVAPSVFVPAWWGLYPPAEEQYRQLFALGHNDMLTWLWKNYVVEKPPTSEERKEKLMKYESSKMPQKHGFFGYILDFFALIFFLGLLRPFAFIAIYAELWFVSTIAFFATIFHEFFPTTFDFLIGTNSLRNKKRGGGTRMDSLKDLLEAFRNIVSLRTWAHLTFGYRHVNSKRLGKYSRLYRVLKPFVAGGSSSSDEKKHRHHHHHRHQQEQESKKDK